MQWCASNQPICLPERSGYLWCTFMCVPYTAKCIEEWAARIVQIDFSAAFDMVNHQGILYRLCSVGIGGSVSSILTQFLSNRSQHTVVDGCLSKLVDVVSGVPQGSVLGPLIIVPPVNFGAFSGK